jgi:hypothetical protein
LRLEVLGSAGDPLNIPLTLEMASFSFHDSEPESPTAPAALVGYVGLWWAQMLVHPVSLAILGLKPRVHEGFY